MKKKILIFLIIFFVLFLGVLTIYKTLRKKDKKEEEIKTVTIKENKKEDINTEKKDKETYSVNVITENVKKYDYELIIDEYGISGSVFIGKDSKLYINDNKSNLYEVSNLLFKTLYKVDSSSVILNLYALSNDGKLYYVFLNQLDIDKIIITEIKTNFKITNFTNIKLNDPYSYLNTNIVVLLENGNMYEPRTGIRYTNKLITYYGQYFIFEDNTIANSFGNLLKNGDNNYKIKYYLTFMENESPFKDTYSVIITEDNKIIYCVENDNTLNVYNKIIKDIKYTNIENEYKVVNLTLTFTDNSTMNFNTMYTEYYGFE